VVSKSLLSSSRRTKYFCEELSSPYGPLLLERRAVFLWPFDIQNVVKDLRLKPDNVSEAIHADGVTYWCYDFYFSKGVYKMGCFWE